MSSTTVFVSNSASYDSTYSTESITITPLYNRASSSIVTLYHSPDVRSVIDSLPNQVYERPTRHNKILTLILTL
jgi:hypothetical protein